MNTKHKTFVFLILFASLFFSGNALAAQSVDINGQAYADSVGLIHFDASTADNKWNFTDAKYFVGPTKQFRISPFDSAIPASPAYTPHANRVRISTEAADCDINPGTVDDGCLIKGFAWSDSIGWIALDGFAIQQEIISVGGSAADFPKKYWPRVKSSSSDPNRVGITGIGWNWHTGWITLSSDTGGTTGVVTDESAQLDGNFGVYLEIAEEVQRVVVDPGPPAITEKLGRRIRGYAWSQNLQGWIKFSKAPTDTLNFESLTLWVPDRTPPIPLAPFKDYNTPAQVWFAPGVNTGYPEILNPDPTEKIFNHVPQNIIWEDFAIDPESGINTKDTKLFLDPKTANCNVSTIGKLTNPLPPKYDSLGVGDTLLPYFAEMGNTKNSVDGYCKYDLHAEIWNDVNQVIYYGTLFPPDANAVSEKRAFPKVEVYVRAGDPSDEMSDISVNPNTPDSLIADGVDDAHYTIDLLDIAGNKVVDIDCSAEYTGCPGREVMVTTDILNELTFDLTSEFPTIYNPLSNGPPRPVIYGDGQGVNTSVEFLETDLAYQGAGSNLWSGVEIHRVPSSNNYHLELASFAPSGSFFVSKNGTEMTNPRELTIQSFDYSVNNEKLPNFSRAVDTLIQNHTIGSEWYTLKTDTDKEVAACFDDNLAATLPACLNPSFPATPAPSSKNPGPRWDSAIHANFQHTVEKSITFLPAIYTDSAEINGEVDTVLSTTSPVDIDFSVKNRSGRDLTATIGASDEGGLAVDNVFQFYGASGSAGAVEVAQIQNTSSGDPNTNPDLTLGWKDPFEYCPDCTRYEMYLEGSDHYNQDAYTPVNSQFANRFEDNALHPGEKFFFNFNIKDPSGLKGYTKSYADMISDSSPDPKPTGFDTSLPSSTDQIDADGIYYPSGIAEIPRILGPIKKVEAGGDLANPYNYDIGSIDRSDKSDLNLTGGGEVVKSIKFFINKIGKGNLKDFNFRLAQEVAYRFPEQKVFTVYSAKTPILKDIEVRDVGLEAIGTVATEQLVTGRRFDTIGTAGTRKLQEQIRRNVAELVAGIDTSACTIPSGPQPGFDVTSGTCLIEDTVSGTLVRIYEGDKDDLLTIGNGTDITAPNKPYTMIVKGGANVFIRNNILSDTNSSLGIILIADSIRQDQANLYLSPNPTNISAVLYAEGSLLSMADNYTGGSTDNYVYFGGGGGDVKELKNQMYWRGSIASRNTIAGATQKKYPTGVDCLTNDTSFSCAQRYDLDYLRRFAVDIDETAGTSFILNNGMFSGGGTCDTNGNCSCADCNSPIPSLITLKTSAASSYKIIDEASSELSAVFVVNDPQSLNNPPPGFTISVGLESIQEIR